MRSRTSALHITLALVAAAAMVVAAPVHSSHHHDDAGTSTVVHTQCAVCQMHAPAGTSVDAVVAVVEPDRLGQFVAVHPVVFPPAPHGAVDASRAPPLLLAA